MIMYEKQIDYPKQKIEKAILDNQELESKDF